MPTRFILIMTGLTLVHSAHLTGQVVLSPTHLKPATLDRIGMQISNQIDDPIVQVHITVPEVIAIVGVDAPNGWTFELERATDTTPQHIEFSGGGVTRWELEEFSFMGRIEADTKKENLVFPTSVVRASGETTRWARAEGAQGAPPFIVVEGTTEITGWGTLAAAAGAFGMALLALAFSVVRSRPPEPTKTG